MSYNLLDFSRGGGCGCKLDASKLHAILAGHRKGETKSILIDFMQRDDAAVIELSTDLCLIQTVDFFLPMLSNAYDFGQVTAANALSDVYAMGGKPLMALSLLGWPHEKLPLEIASEVLKGAEDICKQAGINISGGHSIETSEPLFGLSVSGIASKKSIKSKNTCKEGDLLYITKPLGLGLMFNAIRHELLSEAGYKELLRIATSLNTLGTILGGLEEVSAMTDVTGFGLLGHLSEMLGKEKGAVLFRDQIPVLEEARFIAQKMLYPNLTTGNYNMVSGRCQGLEGLEFLIYCDPQTSGGLLFSSHKPVEMKEVVCIGRVEKNTDIIIQ